ncbi:hypothetical protein [Hymenobacter coalescens]
MFADLHSHPLGRSFNYLRNSASDVAGNADYHGWNIPQSDLRKLARGRRAYAYSQCDLARLTKGGVRLVFASLYPLEKGFFLKEKQLWRRLAGVDDDDERERILARRINNKAARRSLRDLLQARKMRMTPARINFLQSSGYDYFEELLLEYRFHTLRHNVSIALKNFPFNAESTGDVNGRYRLVHNGREADELLADAASQDIAVVLTVEGMHALGVGNPPGMGEDVSTEELKRRIGILKGQQPGVWEYPVLFITFAHHFSNGLCGHAHSLPSSARLIMDQSRDMNAGFVNDGLLIARELLGLDEQGRDNGTRRILLDVKHMSAQSRQQYYEQIVRPYNAANPARKIPVVASHVGYSGCATLTELVHDSGSEQDNTAQDEFLRWNINLCDDDVAEIHASEGLLGMSFDQRVLGVDRTFLGLIRVADRERNSIMAFERMLERVVRVPFVRHLPNPQRIWQTLTIGTDFDGFIDPVDPYPTVMEFSAFAEHLGTRLNRWHNDTQDRGGYSRAQLLAGLSVEELVQAISIGNAREFVKKHFVERVVA